MPISIPLTLRLVKGSKLTFAELDTNFVSLRNAIISVNNSDTFVTGGTYNSLTTSLDFSGNTGFKPFSVDVSSMGGGGISVNTVTYLELTDLITNEELIPGSLYIITDTQTDLYGGTEIILQAISTTTLNPKGIGKFYNPIYTGTGNGVWNKYAWFAASSLSGNFNRGESITANNGATGTLVGIVNPSINSQFTFFIPTGGDWTTATSITGNTTSNTANITNISVPSYSIGAKVNWGGRVWVNLTGSVGDGSTVNTFSIPKFANPYSLDSTNWEIVPYDEVDYIVEWDEITDDVEKDFITQLDKSIKILKKKK
jgi:hypothetical protein